MKPIYFVTGTMKTYRFRSRIENPGYLLPSAANRNLNHLPGPKAPWLTGHLNRFLSDDHAYITEQANRYGNVFTMPNLFGRRAVFMLGAEANKVVLGNASKLFSNHHAYRPVRSFAGESVVTRDLEDHSELRKMVAQLFSRRTITGYLEIINSLCIKTVHNITNSPNQKIDTYPIAKSFALDVAGKVFAGIDNSGQDKLMTDALAAMLDQGNTVLPLPIPGTTYYRAIRGRNYANRFFRRQIPRRRESEEKDFFTHLCSAENDEGERLSDDDVVDNVIGVMIAGHDTSTIAIVALLVELAKHPERQTQLAAECQAIFTRTGSETLPASEQSTLANIDLYVKEVLRIHTPLRYLQRRLTDAFTFDGHTIPTNSNVIVGLHHTHQNNDYFENPKRFFPERFADNSPLKKIPPYAWAPFGKGAHLCIGMQFVMLEIKAFLYHFLLKYQVDVEQEYELKLAGLPVSKPVDGVPLKLSERRQVAGADR